VNQNCSVLCRVRQLYTMMREQFLMLSVGFRFRFSILCVFLF